MEKKNFKKCLFFLCLTLHQLIFGSRSKLDISHVCLLYNGTMEIHENMLNSAMKMFLCPRGKNVLVICKIDQYLSLSNS